MSAKIFYHVLAILLGCALIVGSFILFGESLETRIKVLDIIVSILVYSQFMQLTVYPLVDMNRPAHKEVGMMGIFYSVFGFCSISAISLVVLGIVYDLSFHVQLIGQLIILFIALFGRVATLHSGGKVQQVYEKEQQMMVGKMSLRRQMDDYMSNISTEKSLEMSSLQQLQDIQESLRFLSPSVSPEAKQLEDEFISSLESLKVMMRDAEMNKESIKYEISHLQRTLSRRKQF